MTPNPKAREMKVCEKFKLDARYFNGMQAIVTLHGNFTIKDKLEHAKEMTESMVCQIKFHPRRKEPKR